MIIIVIVIITTIIIIVIIKTNQFFIFCIGFGINTYQNIYGIIEGT